MNADYLEIRQAYIAHFGIKGQKWGLRRFQSYETAPTQSGFVGQEVGEAAKQRKNYSDDYLRAKELSKKKKYELSNDDLEFLNKRRGLERAYSKKKNDSYVKKAAIDTTAKLVQFAAIAAVSYVGIKHLKKKYNLNAESITKKILETAGAVGSTAMKEVAKGSTAAATAVGKEALKGAATAGHNIRKAAASTSAARKYVKTVNSVMRNIRG